MYIKLKKYLLIYAQSVRCFEFAMINKYTIKGQPYFFKKLFPLKGVIFISDQAVYYNYHGAGCSLKFPNFDLDYNVVGAGDGDLYISLWSFKEFYRAQESIAEDIPLAKMLACLDLFVQNGVLACHAENGLRSYFFAKNWLHENAISISILLNKMN
ncbi:hypothetical protein SapgrDRAFT_0202 [Saprospira grandis DSM 2844]|uniref:DUF6896 domain-containing protein n=1 Tax=Saprospira grandis DSM 2844 TaxID=694433 RepID=J0P3G6_9BACT|nr:hypothetical protein SapgrDRAFT_0202 [Saprospira grandis DSM 2844]